MLDEWRLLISHQAPNQDHWESTGLRVTWQMAHNPDNVDASRLCRVLHDDLCNRIALAGQCNNDRCQGGHARPAWVLVHPAQQLCTVPKIQLLQKHAREGAVLPRVQGACDVRERVSADACATPALSKCWTPPSHSHFPLACDTNCDAACASYKNDPFHAPRCASGKSANRIVADVQRILQCAVRVSEPRGRSAEFMSSDQGLA
jgi:hypothetical protein